MRIITDAAADLNKQEAEELNIQIAPLFIQFPEGEVSSNDLTPDEFYERLSDIAPQIPKTSQPSTGIFSKMFSDLVDIGEDVISVHISSGLSGTIESARLAAQQLPGKSIDIVDSLTLSGGERFQVIAAAMAAKVGRTREFILDRLSKIRAETEVVFTLETLEYLQRGGRIGRVQAITGSLLHIKPVIHVDKRDGKYSTIGRERTIQKSLGKITQYIAQVYGTAPLWVSIMHGQFKEQSDQLASLVKGSLNVGKLEILRISPVLGVHTGPGVVGLAVVPIQLMEGLE